jgi:hypothetical protein
VVNGVKVVLSLTITAFGSYCLILNISKHISKYTTVEVRLQIWRQGSAGDTKFSSMKIYQWHSGLWEWIRSALKYRIA